MSYIDVVSTLTLVADLAIVVILVVEFNYDKMVYERDEYRRARRRKKFNFEVLTTGESK